MVALVSFLSLVLGELVPKSLALRSPEPVALAVGRPLRALSLLAQPLVWLLTKSSNLVLASATARQVRRVRVTSPPRPATAE